MICKLTTDINYKFNSIKINISLETKILVKQINRKIFIQLKNYDCPKKLKEILEQPISLFLQ